MNVVGANVRSPQFPVPNCAGLLKVQLELRLVFEGLASLAAALVGQDCIAFVCCMGVALAYHRYYENDLLIQVLREATCHSCEM